MSREELVKGYLDGQLSRRVFIRRLVATGVTAAAAISYASLLESQPAQAFSGADFYLVAYDFWFTPTPALLEQGQGVQFAFHGDTVQHKAKDTSGLTLYDTGWVNPSGAAVVAPPPGAGTFPYRCPDTTHVDMRGKLQVPIVVTPSSGALGTSFQIKWADAIPSDAKWVFDVQRRAPGSTTWVDWRVGVTSNKAKATPQTAGTWSYRARVRNVFTGKASAWSPVASILVT